MMPACGPPSSLSPLKSTRSAPAAMLSPTTGSPGKPKRAKSSMRPAADVVDHRQVVLAAEGDQLVERRGLGEAADAVVAVWTRIKSAGVRADGLLVVADAGDVRRADFAQDRPARRP